MSASSTMPAFQMTAFSADAAEFVPSWERSEAALSALRRPFKSTTAEFVPRFLQESDEDSKPRNTTMWKVSSAEFVPRWLRDESASKDSDLTGEDSDATPKLSHRRGSTVTVSTTEGSASSTESASSDLASSRSSSPAPATPQRERSIQNEVAPISVSSLLRWRHAAPSDVDVKVSFAAEPAAGSPEAAVATAVKAMANGEDSPMLESEDAPSPAKPSSRISLRPGSQSCSLSMAPSPSNRRSDESRKVEPRKVAPVAKEEKMWRNVDTVKLEVSTDSWTAKQRARRNSTENDGVLSDEEVVRSMKLILNKLTIERFDALASQLLNCGIRTVAHLEQLIKEIFEKATTQHHFINMYADLCVLLNDNGVVEDTTVKFKKVLLTCCQMSFEKHLEPPKGLTELTGGEREVAESLYKTRMLGNIRFVGALLVRKMLASKVMISICEELLQEPTAEALESLASLLIVVGPAFDCPDFTHYVSLNGVFKQVEKLAKKTSVPKRVRCLLKDVVELRCAGWNDKRPKKIEGPSKLEQVAAQAAFENGESPSPAASGDWAVVGSASRVGKTASKESSSAQALLKFAKASEKLEKMEAARRASKEAAAAKFDKDACREEVRATLAELRVSHDISEAIIRISNIGIPKAEQASQLNDLLARLSEEGSQEIRKACLDVVVGLFADKHWKADAATKGLKQFIEETVEDLICDVPNLPKIVRDEMHPSLSPLVEAKVLDAELHDSLKSL